MTRPNWRFGRADYIFTDPQSPWSFPAKREYSNLAADLADQNFIAIKLGDVNGSWTPPTLSAQAVSSAGPSTVSSPAVKLWAEASSSVASNQVVSIPIKMSAVSGLLTAQFSLKWNPAVLQFSKLSGFGLAGLNSGNFSVRPTDGQVTFSWDDPSAQGVTLAEGTAIFTVEFVAIGATGTSSIISFSDRPTLREVSLLSGIASLTTQAASVTIGAALALDVKIGLRIKFANSEPIVEVSVPTAPGNVYILERCDSLVTRNWQTVTEMAGTGAAIVMDDTTPLTTQRFYRLRLR